MDHIIWLDGDLKFFSDPQPIFDEFEKCSILLTEEKYTDTYEYLSRIYGIYQLGFIGFKREENVIECLKWYRERLLEWCHEKPQEEKWSDQRYAVNWPSTYKNVGIVQNIGVNLTPFILYRFQQENRYLVHKTGDEIYIDKTKLIFFHYYGFKYFDGNEFDLCRHWAKFSDSTFKFLYLDYIYSAIDAIRDIRKLSPGYYMDSVRKGKYVSNYFNLELSCDNHIYCYYTIIDNKSIPNLIELNNSIGSFMDNYRLFVCCLDDKSYSKLKAAGLHNVIAVEPRLTSCEQYRDYSYIGNIVDSFLMSALSKGLKNEVMNIGSGECHSLRYYVELILKHLQTDKKPVYGTVAYRENDLYAAKPDVIKIKKLLDWEPRIGLEAGIEKTVQWFRDNVGEYR